MSSCAEGQIGRGVESVVISRREIDYCVHQFSLSLIMPLYERLYLLHEELRLSVV